MKSISNLRTRLWCYVLISFLLASPICARSQGALPQPAEEKKWNIELLGSPSAESVVFRQKQFKGLWGGYIMAFNYGAVATYRITPKLSVSLAEVIVTKGAKERIVITHSYSPEMVIGNAELLIRSQYVTFPISVNYNIKVSSKSDLVPSLGIINGFNFKQTLENTSIDKNYTPDPNIISRYPPAQRVMEINTMNKYYLGSELSLGMRYHFSKIAISFWPKFAYQLNNAWNPDVLDFNAGFVSFSGEFRVGYKF